MAEQMKGLVVLDPTEDFVAGETHLNPRLGSLDGKVVGFLDNSKLNANRFLAMLEQELLARYRLGGVVHARKPGASRVVSEEVLASLAGCDAVITAMGD